MSVESMASYNITAIEVRRNERFEKNGLQDVIIKKMHGPVNDNDK